MRSSYQAISAAIATVTAEADVCEIDVAGLERVCLEAAVTTATLSAFKVQARFHSGGSYLTIASAAGDYTNPQGIIVGCSGDLTTQAVGSGWIILDVRGIESLKILAAGTSSGVTIKGGAA